MSDYNNELHKHKASDAIKWIVAFVLIIAIMGAVVCLALQVSGVFDFFKKDDAPAEEQSEDVKHDGGLHFDIQNSAPSMSPVDGIQGVSLAITASDPSTLSKTLTATVLPVDAPDKRVDWTVEWCTPLEDKDVTDYITVEPESDGSLTATVICHKGFEGGSVYVSATTRIGSFTATCLVSYEGAPLKFDFSYSGKQVANMGYMDLNTNVTHNINLVMDNTLHSVGSKYGQYEIVSIEGRGKFNAKVAFSANGSIKNEVIEIVDLSKMEWHGYKTNNYNERDLDTALKLDMNQFLTAIVEGNVLKVTVKKSVQSLSYDRTIRNGNVIKYDSPWRDGRASSDDDLYFEIFMKEKISNVSSSIRIHIISTVSGVQLSTGSITF